VFSANDKKRGFMRFRKELLHTSTQLEFGIRQDECPVLIMCFFS